MSSCDLVGLREIEQRIGRPYATLQAWRRAGQLPAPVKVVSGVPLWDWTEVEPVIAELGLHGAVADWVRQVCESGEAKAWREAAGLRQQDVGDRVGVGYSAIAYWEGGDRFPTGPAGVRYARLLAEWAHEFGGPVEGDGDGDR